MTPVCVICRRWACVQLPGHDHVTLCLPCWYWVMVKSQGHYAA